MLKKHAIFFLIFCFVNISYSSDITYGEAALSIVKYSKLFDDNISKNIEINEINVNSLKNPYAIYLTSIGVSFDPIFVEFKRIFNLEDASRVVGQIYLIHSGEIKITGKKIQLPMGYNSWIEFCEINSLKPNDFLNALKVSFKIHDKKFNN